MRITTDSPYKVGTVLTRMSTLRPSNRRAMWPSCGTKRSAMFMLAMILIRETIAGCSCLGGLGRSARTPSMRYLILSVLSNGST